jgi:RNA polymerase sigma factor (sigma-70 family)
MKQALSVNEMVDEQDHRISETIAQQQARLRNFVRRRVPSREDAEDILQDVFSELVEAHRLMQPIEQAGAWLFRVARNRISDLFRKKKPEALQDLQTSLMDGEQFSLEDLLPSPDAGPEAAYARTVLLDVLDNALDELPDEQREVFVAHEIEGRGFKELAAESGLAVNTLISRKHYAVIYLRKRLQVIYDDFNRR